MPETKAQDGFNRIFHQTQAYLFVLLQLEPSLFSVWAISETIGFYLLRIPNLWRTALGVEAGQNTTELFGCRSFAQ